MKSKIGSSHGTSWGAYPERLEAPPSVFDRAVSRVGSPFLRLAKIVSTRQGSFVRMVGSHGKWAAGLSDAKLREEAGEVGGQLREQGFADPLVARCFSLIREASVRTIGKRHFDVQLVGGRVLLNGM